MLDIKIIRDNPEKIKKACVDKGNADPMNVDRVLGADSLKRKLLVEVEKLRAEQNKISKTEISALQMEAAKNLKIQIKVIEERLADADKSFNEAMNKIPNIPLDGVPVGKDDSQNVPVRKIGALPKFDFKPLEHWEIGEKLDIIDTERGAKVAGSRFYYLKGEAALLEFALVNLAMNFLTKKGFIAVIPPVMIKKEMAWAMGYLQQTDDDEAYYLAKDDLYLTATSEQSLGAMHAGEIFNENQLPKLYVGFSTCFRREAGSYGKDTKGILRAHQFDKVEMFVFCKPEDSEKEHQMLLANEEELMQKLNLPYQVVNICTGDLGAPAAKKYDIEVWLPGQNRYRETHSTSNCTDFQARRLNIRYRDKAGKLNFVHTLNGTAFSMRPIIAILENFQQKDGSVKVPKALQKWTWFKQILNPKS